MLVAGRHYHKHVAISAMALETKQGNDFISSARRKTSPLETHFSTNHEIVIETNQQVRTLPVLTSKLSKSKYHLVLRCTSTSLPLLHGPSTLQKFTSFGPLNFCNQQACVLPKHFSLLFPLATIECPLISFSNRHCSSKKAHAITQRDHLVMFVSINDGRNANLRRTSFLLISSTSRYCTTWFCLPISAAT